VRPLLSQPAGCTSQGLPAPDVALIEKPFSATELPDMAALVLNGDFSGFETIERRPSDVAETSAAVLSPCLAGPAFGGQGMER
jgi:hypothetical protein